MGTCSIQLLDRKFWILPAEIKARPAAGPEP